MTSNGYQISPETRKEIENWITRYPPRYERSAVVPALWLVQKAAGGWLPPGASQAVAELLNMASIRVEEIVSFYSMFNEKPVGTFFVQVCGTTPCRLCGAGDIIGICGERIGPEGELSPCGRFSWLEVECLGACVNAPMVQIGDDYHERLSAGDFDTLLDQLETKGRSDVGRIGAARGECADVLTDTALHDGTRAALRQLPNAPDVGK